MHRSSRQEINKEWANLTNTVDEINLADTYGTFHPVIAEYMFFLSTHATFSKIRL